MCVYVPVCAFVDAHTCVNVCVCVCGQSKDDDKDLMLALTNMSKHTPGLLTNSMTPEGQHAYTHCLHTRVSHTHLTHTILHIHFTNALFVPLCLC